MQTDFDMMTAAVELMVLIFSIVMHEVAHGYVAFRLGDPTAMMARRLTLNPIEHIDLMGSIVVPILMIVSTGVPFGWAKPVPVNHSYFRHPRRDTILVSVAGVTTNLAIAIVAALLFRLLTPDPGSALYMFFTWTCIINVVLAVFNMVPIPPLDGSHVLAEFLPARRAEKYLSFARYGTFALMLLLVSGVLWIVIGPIIGFLVNNLLGF